jgi:hypothetical protein
MASQGNIMMVQAHIDLVYYTGTTMQDCSIVVALELVNNTTFAMTNYLCRPWKIYSRTVVTGLDAANSFGKDGEVGGMTYVVFLVDIVLVCYVWACCG